MDLDEVAFMSLHEKVATFQSLPFGEAQVILSIFAYINT